VGNVSMNVYAKFRCALLRTKKALGTTDRTDNNKNKNNNYSGFLGPAFWVQK